jgi:hypothetical protein
MIDCIEIMLSIGGTSAAFEIQNGTIEPPKWDFASVPGGDPAVRQASEVAIHHEAVRSSPVRRFTSIDSDPSLLRESPHLPRPSDVRVLDRCTRLD